MSNIRFDIALGICFITVGGGGGVVRVLINV